MALGPSGQADLINAQIQAEQLARQHVEIRQAQSHESRLTRAIRSIASTLIVLLVVGSAVWLAGGDSATVSIGVVLSLGVLVLMAIWSRHRSQAHVLRPDENN